MNWDMAMTEKRELDDRHLEGLFAAARAIAPTPSADLMGRVLADAAEVMEGFAAPMRSPAQVVPASLAARMIAGIGGGRALAGLLAAAVAGVAIGAVSPEIVWTLSGGALGAEIGYDPNEFLPSYGDLLVEG